MRKPPRKIATAFTLVEIMIVVAVIGIIIAIAVPAFLRAREVSRARSCQENLAKISAAVDLYAIDNDLTTGNPVTKDDLTLAGGTGYLKSWPVCPSLGTYTEPNSVDVAPACSIGENLASSVYAPHVILSGIQATP